MDLESTHTNPMIGRVFGDDFEVTAPLGGGGMGMVYRAHQRSTDRPCAIKVIHPHLVTDAMRMRFNREGQALSRLNHPSIVTVYRCGEDSEGLLYIAMEMVDGLSLADVLKDESTIPVARAMPWMLQMTEALAYAHEQGVLHRDLKPANLLVRKLLDREIITVLDFGLAKFLDGTAMKETTMGKALGSPPYMAPEQWGEEGEVDPRTDVYALGCLFYRLLTGSHAFTSHNLVGYMRVHLDSSPLDPNELAPQLAEFSAMGRVLRGCIARNQEDRFPSSAALLMALRAIDRSLQSGTPPELSLPPGSDKAWAAFPEATMVDEEGLNAISAAVPDTQTGVQAGVSKGDTVSQTARVRERLVWATVLVMSVGGLLWWSAASAPVSAPASSVVTDEASMDVTTSAPAPTESPASPEVSTAVEPETPTSAPRPAVANPGPAVANPGPAVADAAPAAEGAPAAASFVTVALASQPSGATVIVEGVVSGRTPMELKVPTSGAVEVKIVRRGYRTVIRRLDAAQVRALGAMPSLSIPLERRAVTRETAPTPKKERPPSGLKLDGLRIE